MAESEGVVHPTDDAEGVEGFDIELAEFEFAEYEPIPKALVGAYLIG